MTCPHCNKEWNKVASIGPEALSVDFRPAICLVCGEISITENRTLRKLTDADIVLIKEAGFYERLLQDSKNAKRRILDKSDSEKIIGYKRIDLFGGHTSRGTFDDFFSNKKYNTLDEAYRANDYVECDYVIDSENIIYIEARNVNNPDVRKYHRLIYQHCPAGIDALDDSLAAEMTATMI